MATQKNARSSVSSLTMPYVLARHYLIRITFLLHNRDVYILFSILTLCTHLDKTFISITEIFMILRLD